MNNVVNFEKEVWRKIEGYDNYAVSNLGRVKNVSTNTILKPVITETNKSPRINLSSNNKKMTTFYIRDLVAKYYMNEYEEGCIVVNLDEDVENNNVNNLCVINPNEINSTTNNEDDNNTAVNYEEGKIYSTKNYNKLKLMAGNRKINENNLKSLVKNMSHKYYGKANPIIVNEKMEIIDGQHRYNACKILGLPVYFMVRKDKNINDVIILNNSGKSWSNKDYTNANINSVSNPSNHKTYERIKEIMDYYKITESTLINILNILKEVNIKKIRDSYKAGTIEITDKEFEYIETFLIDLDDLSDFKKYKSIMFVRAFLSLYRTEGYNHNIMKNKIKFYSKSFKDIIHSAENDYCEMLCDLYNTNNKSYKILTLINKRAGKNKGYKFKFIDKPSSEA